MRCISVLLLINTGFAAVHNPDENFGLRNSSLFEGDMLLPEEQRERAEEGLDIDGIRHKRASSRSKLWPKGVVLYQISPSLSRYSRAMSAIRAGMADWTSKTCIQFKRRTSLSQKAYVFFRYGRGCASYVGRIGRRQDIFLAPGCWHKGICSHEIGHAIGFYHEQSRPDRDKFIRINLANIVSGMESNFYKYSRGKIDSLGTPYDYGSLMHYRSTAFSRNGKPTIVAKKSGVTIGQRRGLSSIDAKQANLLYKAECARRPKPTLKPTPKPTSKSTPKATPKPTPKTTPKPTLYATSKPTSKATPKATPKATLKATPKATPKPTPKTTLKPTPKAKPKPKATCKDRSRKCRRRSWIRRCRRRRRIKNKCKKSCKVC